MTAYEDYLAAVANLVDAVVDADHAAARAQRDAAAAVEEFDRVLQARTRAVQQRATEVAEEFLSMARLLTGRKVVDSGIRLPERVRPMAAPGGVEEVLRRRRTARTDFENAVAAYERAAHEASDGAADAGEALAARRRALAPTARVEAAAVVPQEPAAESVAEVRPSWLRRLLDALAGAFRRDPSSRADAAPPARTPRAVRPALVGGALDRATELGVMSGFEPNALKDVTIPRTPLMHGEPGSGLSESGFSADAVRLGQKGERNFAKALAKVGLIDRFATFWSISMLSKDTYAAEQSDVDCAIVTGRTIWLVDLKYYPGGNVVYRSEDGRTLICQDVATGRPVGQPKKMSKNMQMAVDRFRSRYRNYRTFHLEARVVLVPTNGGVGRIDGVRWPGDIPAVTLPDFLAELKGEPAFVETLDSDLVRRTFQGLLKG